MHFSDVGKIEINQRMIAWSFIVFLTIGLLLFVPDLIYIRTHQIDYPIYKGLLSNLIKFTSIALLIPLLFSCLNRLNTQNLVIRVMFFLLLLLGFILGHLILNEFIQKLAGFRPPGKTLMQLVEYASLRGLEAQFFSFTLPVLGWYLVLRIKIEKGDATLGTKPILDEPLNEILVKNNGKSYWVQLANVSHLESNDYYINLHQPNNRVDLIRRSMNEVEKQMPPYFMRIHRSHIINMHFVEGIQREKSGGSRVLMKDGKRLPISRSRYQSVKKRLISRNF